MNYTMISLPKMCDRGWLHIVLENNDFVLTLNSFETTYLSGNNFEYGTAVVVYAEEHLSTINEAESLTMILYIGSLLLILIILCTMASYLQYLQRRIKYSHDPTGIQIRQQKSLDLDVITEMTSADIDDEKDTNPEALRNLAREKQKEYLSTKYDSYLIQSDCIFDHRTITLCSFYYMLIIFGL